jgi:hypothetical protein
LAAARATGAYDATLSTCACDATLANTSAARTTSVATNHDETAAATATATSDVKRLHASRTSLEASTTADDEASW